MWCLLFFFSSRRRHTRFDCDWSSDVCSSDLAMLEDALSNGQIVLADRYIASNLAHQTARVAAEKRAAFVEWIEHLEYDIYGLPREDLVLYLRVPAVEAQKLVAHKCRIPDVRSIQRKPRAFP